MKGAAGLITCTEDTTTVNPRYNDSGSAQDVHRYVANIVKTNIIIMRISQKLHRERNDIVITMHRYNQVSLYIQTLSRRRVSLLHDIKNGSRLLPSMSFTYRDLTYGALQKIWSWEERIFSTASVMADPIPFLKSSVVFYLKRMTELGVVLKE